MKRFNVVYILIFLRMGFSGMLGADSVRIAQLDPFNLLMDQQVKAYVSVTRSGRPVKGLKKEDFRVFESVTGEKNSYKEVPIVGFQKGANYEEGINFLLLVDNSGSMYWSMDGRITPFVSQRRINIAKRVIRDFLKSVTNPKDRVGLAVFNTYYTALSEPTKDRVQVEKTLDQITMPNREQYYTEIYASLNMAVREFRSIRGRKVIIVLSDGRNDYFSLTEKRPHSVFANKLYTPDEAVQSCLKEGISVFAINFGRGQLKDRQLGKITDQTGGKIFDARSETDLGRMYRQIVTLIVNEFRLTYRATMDPADIKYVKVRLKKGKGAVRYYFSSTVFGLPVGFFPLLLLPFFAALALLWLLSKFSFEHKQIGPGLDILDTAGTVVFGGNKGGGTMALSTSARTVIGMGSGKTIISNNPADLESDTASINYDRRRNAYVLNATQPIRVNNNPVKTKILKSGDVLNVDGSTIVFDEGTGEGA